MGINIFVFDLDGVITNPSDSSVDTKTVAHIYELLKNNTYVAINTGRSYAWVKDNLLHNLRAINGHEFFDHLYIVCEKGGESLAWQNDDFCLQPSRFALSKDAIHACEQVFTHNKSELTTMFWDGTKNTMASIEKFPAADLRQFHQQQMVLEQKLKKAFAGKDVKIDSTTIATDVELPGAGKHAGAELIYEWVAQQTDANKVAFICFGDSKSDYAMARHFADKGNKTTFVFVGNSNETLDEHADVKLINTKTLYARGTQEYFANHA